MKRSNPWSNAMDHTFALLFIPPFMALMMGLVEQFRLRV
jgi:hypothetical protein